VLVRVIAEVVSRRDVEVVVVAVEDGVEGVEVVVDVESQERNKCFAPGVMPFPLLCPRKVST
jgi:hypothetical protein